MQLLNLAKYIVKTSSRWGDVTPMKLQKLLFYVKAWGLVAEENLVTADFEKWKYGPVNRKVYHAFKSFVGAPIPGDIFQHVPPPSSDQKELIDFISTCYGQYSAFALSSMTHQEKPWKVTKDQEVIPDELTYAYYSKQPFARNFPFDPDKGPFYPVDSDGASAFTLDMSNKEADDIRAYESYRAYLQQLQGAKKDVNEWYNRLLT